MTTTSTATRGSIVGPKSISDPVALTPDFMASDELEVWEVVTATGVATQMAAGTNYTFTLSTAIPPVVPSPGTIVFVTALAAGSTWEWRRNTELDQQTDLTALGSFPAASVERAFDKLILAIQDVRDIADRNLGPPEADSLDLTLPSAVLRANKALHFDSAGLPTLVATDGDSPYELGGFISGVPVVSSMIFKVVLARTVTFADDFVPSQGHAETAPSGGSVVFDVQVNSLSIGTMSFANGVKTATFVSTGPDVLGAGNTFEVHTPSDMRSLADLSFMFSGLS